MAKTRFLSPVGRLVQGDLDEPQTKDAQGNPRVVKSGPNVGQPNPQYFIAVAIAKTDPAWQEFWSTLVRQAATDFANLFPHGEQGVAAMIQSGGPTLIPQGWCVHPQFAWKVLDGDGYDTNGQPNANKEGFAGHWVVRFGSSYPPRLFHAGHYAPHEQIQEKKAIKRGYYVRVSGTVEGNANAQRPGLYVNLDMVELSGYGAEIVSGPDAASAFGAPAAALPPGASVAPVTPGAPGAPPAAPLAPPAPGAPAAPPSPAAALPAPANPPAPPAGPVRPTDPAHIHAAGTADEQWWVNGAWMKAPAPYTGYMAPPPAPAAPPAAPVPPTPAAPAASTAAPPSPPAAPPSAPPATISPSRVMTAAANGATYEQMLASGWTDETLRAHGMMA